MQAVKMVITGPFNSGKTEFISAISEIDVVSTERRITSAAEQVKETTTVAMDFGRITVGSDLVLYLFGTPGQRRFDFMWEILSEGMLGFVVMVDSTKPETFREARRILETFESYAGTPFVVAANKQDKEDAWGPSLRILRLPETIKVLRRPKREREERVARTSVLERMDEESAASERGCRGRKRYDRRHFEAAAAGENPQCSIISRSYGVLFPSSLQNGRVNRYSVVAKWECCRFA